ncbi:hypothetical protein CpipJ_CPIJ004473 [Culex quinquefasciatus]|uniref:Uncharacterized protein n=1 Tax=Culex quinquefasciatus TaxID=7176 RepID=B0WBH5_CULQU|nr:hypothetical protein CpipJ_CPIJ004473 [Culex quinquefasciatus]|eukprot:XP_001846059.1 hypothetical protein CpipJ_CPIJ004473 [Culex quinquefasciatus]
MKKKQTTFGLCGSYWSVPPQPQPTIATVTGTAQAQAVFTVVRLRQLVVSSKAVILAIIIIPEESPSRRYEPPTTLLHHPQSHAPGKQKTSARIHVFEGRRHTQYVRTYTRSRKNSPPKIKKRRDRAKETL